MTDITDFSQRVQGLVDDLIDRPFEDAEPVLESWFHGLTMRQVLFFSQYWREHGPASTPGRAFLEALMATREPKEEVQRGPRKEVVLIKGRRVVIWRSRATGRFVRRQGGPRRQGNRRVRRR